MRNCWIWAKCIWTAVLVGSATLALAAQTTEVAQTQGTASGSGLLSSLVEARTVVTNSYLTFGLDRVEFLRERSLLGQPLWKYVASLMYLFLAFYGSRFLDYLVGVRVRRWAEKTQSQFDDLVVDTIRGPVRVVAFVIFLHIGLTLFDWPERARFWISKGLLCLVAYSITYMVIKLVDLGLNLWRMRVAATQEKVFTETLFPAIRRTLRILIVLGAVLLTADNLGIEIKTVLAGLSVGGLALGLAGQETVANLIGAIVILLDKPFRIGDRIQLDGVDGVVESIGLRSTRIRNLDGHVVTVPNKTLTNATITNITLRPNIRTLMNITITYDTPAEKIQRAVDILYEIYRAHPMTHDVWISFNKFNDASLNIFVVHWWNGTVFKDYLQGMQELNLQIKRRFDEENIEFAFPTQTLYVKQGSDWRLHGPSDPVPNFSAAGSDANPRG